MLAKLENGHLIKESIIHDGNTIIVNPRDEEYLAHGYKEVEDNRLPEKEGYYQRPTYTEEENKIVANYEYVKLEDEE